MPKRTGTSHALAAFVMLVGGTYLKDVLKLYVDAGDVATVVADAAGTVAAHPDVDATAESVTLVMTGLVVAALAFVWGYAYHRTVL
ncbi:hypothetical protein [Haloarchaeobius iranensis]|uniref:Uncharacterized protein n=1 Tax=Haloarchaeobius iranensis TaxID=996166 RepID=A0A1G9X3C0_9EURY|nr:hypothetical protein [Haloarchaeobius iranensis]SDM91240.1 hypothetical protein SAMN05192554_109132 [Haloarchaeobius iranensis]